MKQTKIFEAYKKKADLLMNYQLARAYYGTNDPILRLVETILKTKYNLEWQEKLIKKAVTEAQGKRDAVIDIPQFGYKEKVSDILAKFVESKFDKMVGDVTSRGLGRYPLAFRDIIERNSES